MTTITTTTTAAPTVTTGFSPKRIMARIVAAMMAAEARAKTRRDYERMMASDEMLRDVGVCREDVRRAMETDQF